MRKMILSVLMVLSLAGMAFAQEAPAQEYCASALECDDGNECTVDFCGTTVNMLESGMMEITAGYCESVIAPDYAVCTGGVCVSGECQAAPAADESTEEEIERGGSGKTNPHYLTASESPVDAPDESVPEFSTVAAGLALAGAGVGYMFLRRMK